MTRNSLFILLLVFAGLLYSTSAGSVTTQYFEIKSFDEFNKGELESSVISSKGELHPGLAVKEHEAEVEGIWDILVISDQEVLAATGNKGKLLRFKNNKFSEEFDTGRLAVTAVTRGEKGVIYFSAFPDAVIYKRDASGKVSTFAELGAQYVWCLAYDPSWGLTAGTGPEGKIFRISSKGEAKELLDTKAEHIMCLLVWKGALYAGTAEPGMLLKVSPGGDYFVEHSFDEEEVRRVIVFSSDGEDVLVVAVNSQRVPGPRPPAGPPMPPPGAPETGEGDEDEENEEEEESFSRPPMRKPPMPSARGRLNSAVYEFRTGRALKNLLSLKGAAVLDLAADRSGNIYVGTDQQGKVYRIENHDLAYEVAFDFKAEQVLSLGAGREGLEWVGTGMTGGLAKVTRSKAGEAAYFTEVFDAEFPAKWGKIQLEPKGTVKLETRTGNTPEADESWSKWENAGPAGDQIKSPAARYLQVKVSWPMGSDDPVSSMQVAYTIYNQPHYIEDLTVLEPGEKVKNKRSMMPARNIPLKPVNKSSNSKSGKDGAPSHETKRSIIWKVQNPDGDELTFEVFYKPEGKNKWIKVPLKEELKKTILDWDTESIPDGYYRVKVAASDAGANKPGDDISAERVSDPFLVDNSRPDITTLNVSPKGRVGGKAKDDMSQIIRFEYSLDGGDWVFFMPEDGVFDENEEEFEFDLDPLPEAGLHIMSVRAFDSGENLGASHTEFSIK